MSFSTFDISNATMGFRTFLFSLFILFSVQLSAQTLPADPVTGKVKYEGNRKVKPWCKKKIMKGMVSWTSVSQQFPPMVFSVIESGKDSLMVKAVTDVPSLRGLHPISFRLILIPGKKTFTFVASEFYFEDIRLSLDTWLKKFADSENKKNQRNVELIIKGLDSHVFMSMNNLAESINNK